MRYALGIDLGGTKILAGVIDLERGKVLATAKRKSRVEDGPDEMMARLGEAAAEAIESAKGNAPEAIGIGVAGQVDRERGVLISGPNLGMGMDNLQIGPQLHKQFKLPVHLGNDVEVAALGEARFGAGKGQGDFVCVFVGTGVGGAIVRDGAIYRGATNTAGEIGHLVIDMDGRLCGCGGRGHLEAYASRTAMVRMILGELRAGRKSVLREALPEDWSHQPGGTAIRSKVLAKAVADKDELALEAVDEAARYLAAGLISVINFYNPPRIVLGGGVVDAVDRLFKEAARYVGLHALATPRKDVEIVRAALGDDSGIVGAAVLAAS